MALDFITRVEPGGIFIDVSRPAYGAVGDGTTDDTAAIQSALDAAYAIGAQEVYFPDGTYKITSTLVVGNDAGFSGIHLRGSGGLVGSQLLWMGSTSGIAVKINRGRGNHIHDISIFNGVAIGTTIGILLSGPASGSQCSAIHFERVFTRDFKVHVQAGEVALNSSASELLFENCGFDSTVVAGTGFLCTTSNSLVNKFSNSSFGFLDVGIDLLAGGDTHVFGGGMGRSVIDIRNQGTGEMLVLGVRFEMNPTEIAVQATNPAPMIVEGCSLAAVVSVPSVPVLQGMGQWTVNNNSFGSGSDIGWKTIEVNTVNGQGSLSMTNNRIFGTTPFYLAPSTSTSDGLTYRLFGNEKWASTAFSSRFPDEEGKVFWPDKSSLTRAGSGLAGTSYSPFQITSNQNNYAPQNPTMSTTISAPMYLRLTSDASRNITGLTFLPAPVDGQTVRIINVGGQNIVLTHEDAASTAANRFHNSTAANITLLPDQQAELIYDAAVTPSTATPLNRWRVF